jgi:hypothetical protein
MGDSYPKEVITNTSRRKPKTFLRPAVATPELIDEVYASINDRRKLIKTLTIAKSAIRHNMAKTFRMHANCIIWGKMTKLHLQM